MIDLKNGRNIDYESKPKVMNRKYRVRKKISFVLKYALKVLRGGGSIKKFFAKLKRAGAKISDLMLSVEQQRELLKLQLRSIGIPRVVGQL